MFVNITVGSKFKVRITKEDGSTPVSIPCVDTTEWGPVGSCDYEGDAFLGSFSTFFCPGTMSPDDCSLPLRNGAYGRSEPYNLTIPDFDQDFGFLLAGTFNIEITVVRGDGTELACVFFLVEVVQEITSTTEPPATTSGPDTCDQCQVQAGITLDTSLVYTPLC